MKATGRTEPRPVRGWRARWAGAGLAALVWLAAALGPAAAAPVNAYGQLRLLMEALHEVEQKYVGQEQDADLMYGAIRGMVMTLDPASSFLTPQEYQELTAAKGQRATAAMELALKDNVLTVIAPEEEGAAWKAGVKAGDHILKINNQSTRNLTPLEAEQRLTGEPGTKVTLNILRNGALKPMDLTVALEPAVGATVAHKALEGGYHYLRVRAFRERTAAELAEALKAIQGTAGAQGVVLDLRETASGTPEQAAQAAGVFMGNALVYYTKGRSPEPRQAHYGKEAQPGKRRLPLAVLVDGGTAKAAEVLAGALANAGEGVLVGYKTFGLAAVDRVFPLKDGSALVMPVAYVLTPKGHQIQGNGLEPEVAGPAKDQWDKQAALPDKGKPKETAAARDLSQDPLIPEALKALKNWGKPRSARAGERTEAVRKGKQGR